MKYDQARIGVEPHMCPKNESHSSKSKVIPWALFWVLCLFCCCCLEGSTWKMDKHPLTSVQTAGNHDLDTMGLFCHCLGYQKKGLSLLAKVRVAGRLLLLEAVTVGQTLLFSSF